MLKLAPITVALLAAASNLGAQAVIRLEPGAPEWALEGNASVADYLGRKAIRIDGGAAIIKDFELRDGVIDVDIATPAQRGFFGIQFRLVDSTASGEWVYLRQHKSGAPDAMQYTPVLRTGLNWQLYNGTGFTGAVTIPKGEWFHLRLEIAGAQARLFVKDMATPALLIDDLKSGIERGGVALAVLVGETYFSGFEIHRTPDAPWRRRPPPIPPGTLTRWELSPAFDGATRNPERPLSRTEIATMKWEPVEAEAPGLVAINRYRQSPHPRVSFANDFSRRLEPQPGAAMVYARTTVTEPRATVKKLFLGYSDEVSVFLNGTLLYRGRSAQYFRDPGFLGIMSPENDILFLPLAAGPNELILAINELGGGWGFQCRLVDAEVGAGPP